MKGKTENPPVVLITGALAGVGRATAFAFSKVGARLVVSGRREAAVLRTRTLSETRGRGGHHFLQLLKKGRVFMKALVDTEATAFLGSPCAVPLFQFSCPKS